jgi:indolepyruvate ferredoxin oxidoreductase beta subunit
MRRYLPEERHRGGKQIAMETTNIIFCGLGGQGILFMTKVLAQTAMSQGFTVLGAETHGMAQRGGSVISHLRLGDVESSLVSRGKAHYLLALEESESYRSLPFLSKGGGLFVNSNNSSFPREEVKKYLETKEIKYHHMAASEVAMNLDAPRSSNLALLGFFSAFIEESISDNDIRTTIDNISPARFKEINLKVFNAGHEKGLAEKGG